MQILAVVGSLRAGKSTLVESTILQATQSGALGHMRAAYLLNDRPSPDGRMVDGEKIRNVARVIPFPNRCFTCEDAENLARQLHALSNEGETDLVVIEGYGFVAGAETSEALKMTGFPFGIFSLIDAEHLAENRAAYGEVIESQLACATLGIGITHVVNGDAEASFDLASHHAKPGVPSLVIPKGHGMPPRLFARVLAKIEEQDLCGCSHCSSMNYDRTAHEHVHHDHGHEHHHDHQGHEHRHEHDHAHHDFFSVTFPLRAEVTSEMLREALASEPVFRAKGVATGVRFDMLHGTWSEGDNVGQSGIVTLYSRSREIKLPAHLVDNEVRADTDRRSTKELLRQDIDPESAKAALERLAAAIPTEPVILPGSDGMRVAVQLEELQLLKQIAQRPSVKDDWLLTAVEVAISYWVACVIFIEKHADKMDEHELPVSRQELGLSLGWWTNRFEKQLDAGLVAVVAKCRIGRHLASGMAGSWLHSNPKQAAAQAEYYLDVSRFAARHGEDPDLLRAVLGRGVEATRHGNPSVSQAWNAAYRSFSEPATVS